MALKPRISSFWHFLVRLAGLTGALFLGCGLFAWFTLEHQPLGAGFVTAGGLLVLVWLIVEFIAAFDHFSGERQIGDSAARLLVEIQCRLAEAGRLRKTYIARNDGAKHLPREMFRELCGHFIARLLRGSNMVRRMPCISSSGFGPALICSTVLINAVRPSSA